MRKGQALLSSCLWKNCGKLLSDGAPNTLKTAIKKGKKFTFFLCL
jgi:hypothetical protein